MRPGLLTTVAAAALSVGLATAMAQSGSGPSGDRPGAQGQPSSAGRGAPDRGSGSDIGSPPASAAKDQAPSGRQGAAPNRSESLGQNSGSGTTPGSSPDRAGSEGRGGDNSGPGRREAAPGENRQNPGGSGEDSDRKQAGSRSQQGTDGRASRDGAKNAPSAEDNSRSGRAAEGGAGRGEQSGDPQRRAGQARGDQPAGSETPGSRAGREGDQSTGQRTTQDQDTSRTRSATSSASGAGDLPEEKRTRLRQTFSNQNLSRSTNLNISVSVGTTIPSRVNVRPVPSSIVQIVPQYRGYRYTVVEDRVVIVEPGTRRVVEVIELDGGSSRGAVAAGSGGSIRLSKQQRTSVRRALRDASGGFVIREGATAPSCLELSEVPQSLASRMPELRGYRYFAVGEDVVLVEPESRRIVSVIE